MDFIDKLSDTLSQTAKILGQKSSDFIELSKLNLAIQRKQDQIEEKYEEIGRYVYDKLQRTNSVTREELYSWIKEIHLLEKDIESLEGMALSIRNVKYCTYCNTEFHKDTNYCPLCGKYINI